MAAEVFIARESGVSPLKTQNVLGKPLRNTTRLSNGDILGYSRMLSKGDADTRFVVVEDRGNRVLVTDTRLLKYPLPGTRVIAKSELRMISRKK